MVTYFTLFFFFFLPLWPANPQTRHPGYLLDSNATPPGFGVQRFSRLLSRQITPAFTFFFPPPSSVSSPFGHLSFVYFPCSLPPFSSYPPFTLCPSRRPRSETRSLSDATWDAASSPVPRFSLSLSLCLSIFQRAAGKALPLPLPSPLPLWVSPFPLRPDCPKNSPYLLHTPKQRNNVLIFTCDTDAFWDSLKIQKKAIFLKFWCWTNLFASAHQLHVLTAATPPVRAHKHQHISLTTADNIVFWRFHLREDTPTVRATWSHIHTSAEQQLSALLDSANERAPLVTTGLLRQRGFLDLSDVFMQESSTNTNSIGILHQHVQKKHFY